MSYEVRNNSSDLLSVARRCYFEGKQDIEIIYYLKARYPEASTLTQSELERLVSRAKSG